MLPILLVGLGGFVGAILRYLLAGIVQTQFHDFPGGTFAVNFIGSFVLSFSMYGTEYKGLFSDQTRLFLTIGLLGAFTTMSTFNFETFKLLEENNFSLMFFNIFANVVLGLLAIYLGRVVVLFWMK